MQLSDAPVATSQQFGDSLAIDLDASGAPIGVELLMASARATTLSWRYCSLPLPSCR